MKILNVLAEGQSNLLKSGGCVGTCIFSVATESALIVCRAQPKTQFITLMARVGYNEQLHVGDEIQKFFQLRILSRTLCKRNGIYIYLKSNQLTLVWTQEADESYLCFIYQNWKLWSAHTHHSLLVKKRR